MVNKAEIYKDEDDKQMAKIAVRNKLEAYLFNVKLAIEESGDKLSESDKTTVTSECEEALRWLDNNTLEEKEEIE